MAGRINDPLEHEANREAERIVRSRDSADAMSLSVNPARDTPAMQTDARANAAGHGAPVRRRREQGARVLAAPAAAPQVVHRALASSGQPLDARTRAFMEPCFDRDFSNVRVHTGPLAAEAAWTVAAQAFTVGSDIVFGNHKLAMDSESGRLLLAHELSHVAQQADGLGSGTLQAAPEPSKSTAPNRPKPRRFWVKVTHEMTPDELLHEFVRQYYHEADEKEIQKKLAIWNWQTAPRRATSADVAKHGLFLVVTDYSQLQIASMSQEQQEALNKQTNERFWQETGYKPGEKLDASAQDKEMAQKWLGVRTDILIENEQSRAINALPDDIKRILFGGDRKLSPDEYETVLKLAARLAKLTPAERQDYLNKVNEGTDSWSDMDVSITRFERELAVREGEEEKTENAAAKLFGLEDLYALYRARNEAHLAYTLAAASGAYYNPRGLQEVMDADRQFSGSLQQNGFKSEAEFTDALEAYRVRFRDEAVHLALEVLAHYDHLLYQERVKFQDRGHAEALVRAIGATRANEYYAAANAKFDEASATRRTIDPEDSQDALTTGMQAAQLDEEGRKFREQAESEVIKGADKDALVDPASLGRGTDREKLAGLDAADAQQYLLEVVQQRQKDANQARAEFTEDPERIFSIPDLVKATQISLGIADNTVYAMSVRDYIDEQKTLHLFSEIAKGILALVLAVLVPGGGWVAAAALIASAGLSVYQAYEAISEYREKEADYQLNFIQDEPSLLWVGVAVAAAALDLGLATSQVFKASAAGLKELEVPLKEFAAASETETAASRLAKLEARIDAVEGLQQEVKDALKARAAAEAGFKKALGEAGGRMMGSLGGAIDPTPIFEAVYYAFKRGANTITKLRKEAQIAELMADASKLEGAAKDELKTVFEQIKKVVSTAKRRGMDDATVLEYVDRVAAQRSGGEGAFEAIAEEMAVWRKPTGQQITTQKQLTEAYDTLASLRRTRRELEAELRAGPKTPQGTPDEEAIAELREQLKGLEDEYRIDPATGRKYTVPGKDISRATELARSAELAAERAAVDPKEIMRQAFNGSEERAAVIEGVLTDQVGTLRTPAQKLTVDHIVSIKQISDMEGFEKLTVLERNELAKLQDNLVVMDSSANFSKGERRWAAWRQASEFYDDATRDAMILREGKLRTQIQDWILDKVRTR